MFGGTKLNVLAFLHAPATTCCTHAATTATLHTPAHHCTLHACTAAPWRGALRRRAAAALA